MSRTASTAALRPCRPLRTWPEASLQRLAEHARAGLQAWARDWECPLGDARAWNACAPALPSPAGQTWTALPCGTHGTVWIGADGEPASQCLSRLILDAPASDAGTTIAWALTEQAWRELQQALAAAWGCAPDTLADDEPAQGAAPPDADSRPWSGAVRIRISMGSAFQHTLWLHLSEAVAARCAAQGVAAPSRAADASPPARIDAAIQATPLRLRVALAPMSIEIGGLISLRPGDVITTSHRLNSPLQINLRTDGTHSATVPLCVGQLGARDDRKAVAIEATPVREPFSLAASAAIHP